MLAVVIAVLLCVVAYDRLLLILWDGHTDMEIEFVVTDAETGAATPDARIEIESDESYCDERDQREFTLTTNADGVASSISHTVFCGGTRSGLGITESYDFLLPHWRYRVIAAGYMPREAVRLEGSTNAHDVERLGPRQSRFVVPVALRKSRE
jgi:hypothetical protein